MKNLISLFFILLSVQLVSAQSVIGKWKSIDDETGDAKSIVEIYTNGGDELEGKIISLINPPADDPDPVCEECPKDDPRHMQKVIGMVIMKDMTPDGEEYAGGTILKPDEGKIYKCRIWLEEGKLKVRGYWGPFFRTQTWIKAN